MQGTLKIDVTANLTRLDADLNKASSLIQANLDAFGKRMRSAGKPIVLPVEIAPLSEQQCKAMEMQYASISAEMAQRWRESDQKYWKPRDEYVDRVQVLQEQANAGVISPERQREGIDQAQEAYDRAEAKPASMTSLDKLGEQASKQLQQTFTDFLFDPFNAKVDDMVLTFLKAMQKMAAEAAAEDIFNSIKGSDLWKQGADWLKGSWSQGSQWLSSSVSQGMTWLSTFFANGGVFEHGAHVAFAKGGAFTNGIVSRPTLFPFAKGTGLMGEAGPEAIMPLTRASNGSLGVRALLDVGGTGSGNVIQINTHINVEGGQAKAEDQSGSSDAASKQLGAMITEGAKSVVFKEQQPGGSIWRLVNGR